MNRWFIDTNVLVYADQPASEWHGSSRTLLNTLSAKGDELWISRQVLREYLSTMTRPGPNGIPPLSASRAADAAADFNRMMHVADDVSNVTTRLVALMKSIPSGGKQVHDANIVATMLAYNIPSLLTFNTAHFRRYKDLIQIMAPGGEPIPAGE